MSSSTFHQFFLATFTRSNFEKRIRWEFGKN
uniref:Uncharacterized protein n=1 Tax=Arundo donax TaxID=35708 RepID=A0A0A8ZM35_ARUDO